MLEIERTYLVKKVPSNLSLYKFCRITQGYISPSPSPLRIRQKDDKFELTKKLPIKDGDYSSAEEINIYLTEYEFGKLWTLVEKSLEKIRYYVPIHDGLVAELDVFQEDLKGLALVEVEFVSEEQMEQFQPPEWFSKDVTQENVWLGFLAGKAYRDVKMYVE